MSDLKGVEKLQLLSQFRKLGQKMLAEGLSEDELLEYHQIKQKIENKLSEKDHLHRQNKRKAIRLETPHQIKLQCAQDFKSLYLKNISGGGVYLVCEPQPAMGEQVRFELSIEGTEKKMKLVGEVAWVNVKRIEGLDPGVGLKFVEMTPERERFVNQLIHEALEKKWEDLKKK